MEDKKRVLIVTQEMFPYTESKGISELVNKLPQAIQDSGMETRVLMPKFGSINERRHRLHEVVRLSGMNIIVDDDDYPLIIKVASLPGARMQVYFLDNDDFFKRKNLYADDVSTVYEDNTERMVFFCKSIFETVKKFGWAPDIIHCHGWMTSLVPLYLKLAYRHDPIFKHAKAVYSQYDGGVQVSDAAGFMKKAAINHLTEADLLPFKQEDGSIDLNRGAALTADGVILGEQSLNGEMLASLDALGVPTLPWQTEEASFAEGYMSFYNSLFEEKINV